MIFKKSCLVLVGLVFTACGGGGGTGGTVNTSNLPTNSSIKVSLTKTSNKPVSKITHTVSSNPNKIHPKAICGDVSKAEPKVTVSYAINQSVNTVNKVTSNDTSNKTTATISGKITFDSIPFKTGGRLGLDYDAKIVKNVRGATVQIVNASGTTVGTTTTDVNGDYSITVTEDEVKVRVLAQLYKAPSSGESSWNFQIKDNTNGDALYVMEGSLASLGTTGTQIRNLNAASGWGGSSYTSTRAAAPFSMLDVVYEAIEKVTSAQSDAVFGSLDVFWSKDNIASSGNKNLGQITTSHFDGTALYILGKENSDTDEYDTAVVAHEWGHYYEAKFSRSDSIGGSHGSADMLDIRVAFGEGFGTAFGCIIINSNLYLDSSGTRQETTGVFSDVEAGGSRTNPGWYNEASIYSILYDIYDSDNDVGDTLSLGFTPMHQALIGAQKNTAAFTSIFSFIKVLKDENPSSAVAIDALTSNESIAPITDIYGTGRTNRAVNANPLYSTLTEGGSIGIVLDYSATATSTDNMLGRYNFVKFTISNPGTYTIDLSQIAGSAALDPDMSLYKEGSTTAIAEITNEGTTDTISVDLTAGNYRMAVIVYTSN
ncbi:MAG: Unknown protein [uncultured Sulfurovum sp.]|uniref:Lipoprotein n=1 Tax=uncultured Sulfurovum sp. TaxID=269237 RepID=A0A6S6SH84_9BACT|nr:MAG: Unknown protein [uncultured Sulfurovum sp.]